MIEVIVFQLDGIGHAELLTASASEPIGPRGDK
jgi:hypothetical protein